MDISETNLILVMRIVQDQISVCLY